MSFEKFLFKKVPVWVLLLTIILSLVLAILFGSLVLRSSTAKKIALIPNILNEIFLGTDKDFLTGPDNFKGSKKFIQFSNKAEDLDSYILLSRYDYKKKRSIVEILNVKSGKIVHTWAPNINKINSSSKLPKEFNLKRDHNVSRYRINHPLLLKNGDLIIHSMNSPLVRISPCSEVRWFIDKPFHHSTELDSEGNIWVPGINFPPTLKGINVDSNRADGKIFIEDTIEKISKNGKILFSKPVIQILIDNNLEYMLPPGWQIAYGGENLDPLHLNEIQPVFYDGKYWKKNDVFISLRHISLVFLYRPSTNKIIWYKQGPWVFQHDVDIVNDHQIAIFDNNVDDLLNANKKGFSETLIYDFEKNKIFSPYKTGYEKNNISTIREGLSEILENGDIFVEETWKGRLLRMDKIGNLKWQFVNREKNGKIYVLNWSRLLNKNLYSSTIDKITSTNCNNN